MGYDVKQTFSKIFKRYDLANSILSAGRDATWRRNAVSLLCSADLADSSDLRGTSNPTSHHQSSIKPAVSGVERHPASRKRSRTASRIFLDLCTGTGKLAFETSRRFGAEVIGLDFSEKMMRWGREGDNSSIQPASQQGGHPTSSINVSFVLGDAQVLPFQENLFDGVIIGFGIRNIPDVEKALSEMYRVVKPGGRAIILEFSRPQSFFLLPPYNFYLKNILPWIGGFLTGEKPSYSYLAQSISEFPIYEKFLQVMKEANWKNVKYHPLSGGIATIYTGRK
jgi:demethylmenaquinone methyltransferase/2-methoxy-6-polyprenyl-1,4-benzoquinol methylase